MNQYAGFEDVASIQAAAALNEEKGQLTVFVINACLDEPQFLSMDMRGFDSWQYAGHSEMYAKHSGDMNSYEHPDLIIPTENRKTSCRNSILEAVLAPASWNVFRFEKNII